MQFNFIANDDDDAHYHTLAASLLDLYDGNYSGALLRIRLRLLLSAIASNELFTWTYNIHRIVLWNCFLNWCKKMFDSQTQRTVSSWVCVCVCSIKYGRFAIVRAYKETHTQITEGEREQKSNFRYENDELLFWFYQTWVQSVESLF